MSDISNARLLNMKTVVRRVREAKSRAVSMLKSDRFLADADWEFVTRKTEIEDPYRDEYDEMEVLIKAMEVLRQGHGDLIRQKLFSWMYVWRCMVGTEVT